MAMNEQELDDLRTTLAADLRQRNFFGWLLSNGSSGLWAKTSPEDEIARVTVEVIGQIQNRSGE